MTPEQQRIALAIWDGWEFDGWCYRKDNVRAFYPPVFCEARLPDYLNDLNAVAKLEEKLDVNHLAMYADELDKVCVPVHICPLTHWQAVTCAKASQRCEALLKTLGLWKSE